MSRFESRANASPPSLSRPARSRGYHLDKVPDRGPTRPVHLLHLKLGPPHRLLVEQLAAASLSRVAPVDLTLFNLLSLVLFNDNNHLITSNFE